MRKKELDKARAIWEDTVSESEVMARLNVTAGTLRKLRRDGVIKNYRYASPGTTNNPKRPGKKPMYSLTELVQIFSPVSI